MHKCKMNLLFNFEINKCPSIAGQTNFSVLHLENFDYRALLGQVDKMTFGFSQIQVSSQKIKKTQGINLYFTYLTNSFLASGYDLLIIRPLFFKTNLEACGADLTIIGLATLVAVNFVALYEYLADEPTTMTVVFLVTLKVF